MTRCDYSVALTRALHQVQLSHPVYAVLISIRSGKATTVATASAVLGIAYHSIIWHLRKYPDLFQIQKDRIPHEVELSREGESLLHRVETLVARYAEDDQAGAHCRRRQKPAQPLAVPA